MSVRVVLNAQGVRELISLDEAPVLELAKNAATQVAEALKKELVRKPIDEAVTAKIREMMLSGNYRYSPELTTQAQKLIREFLEKATNNFRLSLTTDAIRMVIRVHVVELLTEERQRAEKKPEDRIDEMIKERLANVFK